MDGSPTDTVSGSSIAMGAIGAPGHQQGLNTSKLMLHNRLHSCRRTCAIHSTLSKLVLVDTLLGK